MKEKHWFLKSREYSISGLLNIINIFSTVGVEARSFLIILLIGNILDKYFAIFIQTFHLVPVYISAYMEQYSHHRHVISWGQFTIYTLPGRMEEEEGGEQDNLSMYVTYSTLFSISCPYSVLCLALDSVESRHFPYQIFCYQNKSEMWRFQVSE